MTTKQKIRVGLVVPHIFINHDILPHVIFSPGYLALNLAEQLYKYDIDVTLFTPGLANSTIPNITADMSYFEKELSLRGDTYLDLLKKHPFTFISLARQVQSELIAKAYAMANKGDIDVIHIFTNEEDTALPFASLVNKPVVFTHHDPFNFLVRYKSVFPKYSQLPWLSLSYAQRTSMPQDTNWVANIYHGLSPNQFRPLPSPTDDYVAYLGRIIEPKGVHLAIEAVQRYNQSASTPLKLKIAGKHYAEHTKDTYWQTKIEPYLGAEIEYVGHIASDANKQEFLGNAKALLVPSTFDEPFGMVTIESLACGTPVIGLSAGATPEIITNNETGFVINKESDVVKGIVNAIEQIHTIDRQKCRQEFEKRFTIDRMAKEHGDVYRVLATE